MVLGWGFPQCLWKSPLGRNDPNVFFPRPNPPRHLCFSSIQVPDHYPEGVNARPHPPAIPAEALARKARLNAAIQAMEAAGPSLEPAPLQELRAAITSRPTRDHDALIAALSIPDLIEEAGDILRTSRRAATDVAFIETLAAHLAPFASKAQQRRSAAWHLDSRRTLVRLQYAKEGGALGFDDGDLHVIFLHAFRLEGLRLALDLGKRPRPLLSVGLPLPSGVGGQAESIDAVFKTEAREGAADLMARLNRRLPEGVRVHQWNSLPTYASPVCELATLSHWRWEPPLEHRIHAKECVAAFLAAEVWAWDRAGSKGDAPLNLRHLVPDMRWEGDALCFSTRMGVFHALNPAKVLMAILNLGLPCPSGLVRTGVDLKPDARLVQAERFEPKLKNMYEDAVLLGGGSNIVLVDEDDDEPIRLGDHSEPT